MKPKKINFNRGIVIVGFPRTGTTLLRTLFDKIEGYLVYSIEIAWLLDYFLKFGNKGTDSQEAWEFLDTHRKFPSSQKWKKINIKTSDFFNYFNSSQTISPQKLFRGVMNLAFQSKDVNNKILVVKYPALIEHEWLVGLLFEQSYVINMIRDPRAAINSHLNRWNKELLYVIKLWNRNIQQRQNFSKYKFIDIKYEDLLMNSEVVSEKLKIFLENPLFDLPQNFQNRIIQFDSANKGKEKMKQLEGFQINKIYTWKRDLNRLQIWTIEKECKVGMDEFGYIKSETETSYSILSQKYKIEFFIKQNIRNTKFLAKKKLLAR